MKKVTFLLNIKKNCIKRSRWGKKGAHNSEQRRNEQGEMSTELSGFFNLCVCAHVPTYRKTCEEGAATFETMG